MERVLGGTCRSCGALFIADPTGKSVGEVVRQGLGIIADTLSMDMADMVEGEDYEEVILSYDIRTHRSAGVPKSFMDGSGRLYAVKAKKKNKI